ncbi:hypothetical protein OOZ63_15365 [Paucibacter sp. PLA-PC-4]|uniref:hypothetical protein n=1 Tax=Paucibacter sp. PLA-PC-4 TaxID=2993655 RepID=UPI0022487AA6|nr:hypothetical protein [Paucibacter sp. PLA-PC-4]MCX2863210.1 hypothetical protein [Paucibacter sp. PLA-PC-4]
MLSAVVTFAVRLLLAVATIVLVLGLMAVALVTMLGLMLWSLVRGRKPVIDVSGFARARQQFRRGAAARAPGEVVDVEVREVKNPAPRLER